MLEAVAVASSAQLHDARALRARTLRLSPSVSVRIGAAAYAVVFSVADVLDYVGFRSAGYELGNAVRSGTPPAGDKRL